MQEAAWTHDTSIRWAVTSVEFRSRRVPGGGAKITAGCFPSF